MTDDELAAARDQVMSLLSWLSNAARAAKDQNLTRANSDLYYATNRAWTELEAHRRRQELVHGRLAAAAISAQLNRFS